MRLGSELVQGLRGTEWRGAVVVLVVLLVVDMVLIGTNVVLRVAWGRGYIEEYSDMWKVAHEGGYGELFNYLKWALASMLMFLAYVRSRAPICMASGWIFLIVLLDDSMQLHENGGFMLSHSLGFEGWMGMRGRDIGELIIWAALGLPVLGLLAYGIIKSHPGERMIGVVVAALLVALFAFGGVVDMVHIAAEQSLSGRAHRLASFGFAILEDGGEMVVASVVVAFSWAVRKAANRRVGETANRRV